MGLWRAQLRRAAAFDGGGGKRLTAAVQNLGRQSAWDQGVVRYLLADLKAGGTYESVHAAAKLVALNGRTPAQQLGAGEGWTPCVRREGCPAAGGDAAGEPSRVSRDLRPAGGQPAGCTRGRSGSGGLASKRCTASPGQHRQRRAEPR